LGRTTARAVPTHLPRVAKGPLVGVVYLAIAVIVSPVTGLALSLLP